MNAKKQTKTNHYPTAGKRLSHILDKIGFKQGRGRITNFQNYLIETCPKDFKGLKYTTVRAWFQDHAPPMQKMDAIINALHAEYQIHHDVSHIKTWWKVGGFYPFTENVSEEHDSLDELKTKIAAVKDKLPFIIMSIVTDEVGEHFSSLSGSELIRISDKATNFAEKFLDPFNTDCPEEHLRLIVQQELLKIIETD
jgi:hypothetical protein